MKKQMIEKDNNKLYKKVEYGEQNCIKKKQFNHLIVKIQRWKFIQIFFILFVMSIGVLIILYFIFSFSFFANYITNYRLLTEQQNIIVSSISFALDMVSSIANALKILFQLTALLFIITDLVNFWNLASIYIFLPIQLPQFTKNILHNVWIQFNQPILSFFNVQFNTITFKQTQVTTYPLGEEYKSALDLDVSEIAFQPLVVFLITALQLILFSIVLKWVKLSFRKIRHKVKQSVKLQDVFIQSDKLKKSYQNKYHNKTISNHHKQQLFNLSDLIMFKSNKVQPLKVQFTKDNKLNKLKQQSMRNIFDQDQSQIATDQLSWHQNKNISKNQPRQQQKYKYKTQQSQLYPQLKLMVIIHKLAQARINSQQQRTKHKSKHWSETINIDKLYILSALLISFMPVLLLPLPKVLSEMKYTSLKQKANLVIYFFILTVIFTYPFVYLTAKLRSHKQVKNSVPLRKQQPNNIKSSKLQQKKSNINESNKQLTKSHSISSININQQTFQTFLLFFMNMTIPICVGLTSTPIWFLSINMLVHILLIASSVTLFKKRSCTGRLKKWNKIAQQVTFFLYHTCFFSIYLFNQVKHHLVLKGYAEQSTIDNAFDILGIMIISIFAIGGLHQMIEFLITIIRDIFKLVYMIVLVISGGYDIKQLQMQIKRLNQQQSELTLLSNTTNNNQKQLLRQDNEKGYNNNLKNIKSIQQHQINPHNTARSLQQLQIDFEIEIQRNQIILNQIKIHNIIQTNRTIQIKDQQH